MKAKVLLLVMVLLMASTVFAQADLTPEQQEAMGEVESAIWSMYAMFRLIATAIGALMLAFTGMKFMTSGNDPMARNEAKNMATYVVIGLVLIWLAEPIARALVFT